MNTLANDLNEKQILTVEQVKYRDLKIALDRLYENKDFQKVILEGYFRERAVEQTSLLAHYSTIQRGTRPQIMEELVAISRLEDFFAIINHLGRDTDDEPDLEDQVE